MFDQVARLIDSLLIELSRHAFLSELVRSTLIGLGIYVTCALIVIAAELSQRSDMSAYRTRNTLNDLAYVIFYQCSIYNLLVSPIFAALSPVLAPVLRSLKHDQLSRLPLPVLLVICWVTFDFFNYWVHRWLHAARPLWAFHSIHHTAKKLTFLTASRIHVIEQLYVGLLMIIPAFLLGIPQPRWLPLLFAQLLIETLQHSRLTWSFGPLRRLFVSPTFHRVHHSAEEEDRGNFGRIFSCWDHLFGTYVDAATVVPRYGVDGMDVPERLTAQFLHPFRFLSSASEPGA